MYRLNSFDYYYSSATEHLNSSIKPCFRNRFLEFAQDLLASIPIKHTGWRIPASAVPTCALLGKKKKLKAKVCASTRTLGIYIAVSY